MKRRILKKSMDAAAGLFHHLGGTAAMRRLQKDRIRILMYHRINDAPDGYLPRETGLYVAPRTFALQMAYLKKKHHVLPLEELIQSIEEKRPLPAHAAVVTFDDGFLDNFQQAYPVLRRLGIPATFFLMPSTWRQRRIWLHRYYWLQHALSEQELLLAFQKAEPKLRGARNGRELLQLMKQKLNLAEREKATQKIYKMTGGPHDRLYIGEKEIKEMQGTISFGSHTLRHHILSSLPDREVREELLESARMLQDATGRKVTTFAYPFGNKDTFDDRTIRILKRQYACAVCTEEGLVHPTDDRYRLKRLSVVEGPLYTFATTLVGFRAAMINIMRRFIRW